MNTKCEKEIPELQDLIKGGCTRAECEYSYCNGVSRKPDKVNENGIKTYMEMRIIPQTDFLTVDMQIVQDPLFLNSDRVAMGDIRISSRARERD